MLYKFICNIKQSQYISEGSYKFRVIRTQLITQLNVVIHLLPPLSARHKQNTRNLWQMYYKSNANIT